MPVPLLAIGAGLGLAKNVGDFFGAKSAEKQAEKELASLQQPFYQIQDEYYQNKNIASEQAQTGLGASALNYYTSEAQRGLGTGIGAIQQTGGNANDITKLFDSYNRNIFSTAAQDSTLQNQKIQQLMATNKDLAGQKTMKWTIDQYQPYQNRLKEITQRRAASQINANNALNSGIGTIASYATGQQNSDLLKALMKGVPSEESNRPYYNNNPDTSIAPRLTPLNPTTLPNGAGITGITDAYSGIPTQYAVNPQIDYTTFPQQLFQQ